FDWKKSLYFVNTSLHYAWDGRQIHPTKNISERRDRRGVGVLCTVSDADERGGAAEKISAAGALQRAAIHGASGMSVADAAARLAAVAGDPATGAALDRSRS